jgi:hypothetical protein
MAHMLPTERGIKITPAVNAPLSKHPVGMFAAIAEHSRNTHLEQKMVHPGIHDVAW